MAVALQKPAGSAEDDRDLDVFQVSRGSGQCGLGAVDCKEATADSSATVQRAVLPVVVVFP